MIRTSITLLGALALLLCVGCGNRGPLYLPDPQAEAEREATITEPD